MLSRSKNNQAIAFGHIRNNSFIQALGKSSGVAVLALLAIVLPACKNEPEAVRPVDPVDRAPEARVADPGSPATMAVDPVDRAPEVRVADPGSPAAPVATVPPLTQLVGTTATTSADVVRVFSPKVFTIRDQLWYGGREVLAVRNDTSPPLSPGKNIEITGTFRRVTVADVQREFDYDPAREFEVEFKDAVVFAANAIESVD